MIRQQNIVIFSSSKSEEKCNTILSFFKGPNHQCYHWDDLFQKYSKDQKNRAILTMLIKKIPTFDFAIILGDATDILEQEIDTQEGKKEKCIIPIMRDNVLFECGLCVMALGTDRVILLKDKSIRIPANLRNGLVMGIETFEYSNDLANFHEKLEDVNNYIERKAAKISPIVIGAAISTADGYFSNFILRFWENIKNGFTDLKTKDEFHPDISQIRMDIYIPDKVSKELKKDIMDFYEINNYRQGIIISDDTFRGVEFRYKIIGNEFVICDYPSTLTASYNTVKDILNLSADDSHDDHAEERFLTKERDSFLFTLKRLMTKESLSLKLETIPYYKKNETEIPRILDLMKQVNIKDPEGNNLGNK